MHVFARVLVCERGCEGWGSFRAFSLFHHIGESAASPLLSYTMLAIFRWTDVLDVLDRWTDVLE